jgi:hypothetical protein
MIIIVIRTNNNNNDDDEDRSKNDIVAVPDNDATMNPNLNNKSHPIIHISRQGWMNRCIQMSCQNLKLLYQHIYDDPCNEHHMNEHKIPNNNNENHPPSHPIRSTQRMISTLAATETTTPTTTTTTITFLSSKMIHKCLVACVTA